MNTVDSCFYHGTQACADGKPLASNPHPEGSTEREFWNRGWMHHFNQLPEPIREARIKAAAHLLEGSNA